MFVDIYRVIVGLLFALSVITIMVLWELMHCGHIMYGYTLLVTMNQRLLKKLSKGRNIDGLKRSSIYTIYYTHLAYVVLQHSVYDGSLMTTYITPLPYIMLFILCSLLNSLLHSY